MATDMHPAAPHHLPAFITAPGDTDYFFNGSAIFLVVMVIILGTLYFRLHALPEHLAHGSENKLQFQLVGVLALLALFTHNNAFWVVALPLRSSGSRTFDASGCHRRRPNENGAMAPARRNSRTTRDSAAGRCERAADSGGRCQPRSGTDFTGRQSAGGEVPPATTEKRRHA